MKKKKRVKYVDNQKANKQIQQAHDNRANAQLYADALSSFKGLKTIDEIQEYLNKETGFKNALMSADALNLKSQYTIVMKFFNAGIDFDVYDENWVVTKEYKAQCFLDATVYYSDEDEKEISAIEKALEKLNELKIPLGCVFQKPTKEFKFNPLRYANAKKLKW